MILRNISVIPFSQCQSHANGIVNMLTSREKIRICVVMLFRFNLRSRMVFA